MRALEKFTPQCPLPLTQYPRVLLSHGSGGRLMQELIQKIFFAAFDNPLLAAAQDSAVLDIPAGRLAMTTDSYVVRPLFFPGGDIGSLAVNGTVNDLAMSGARPLYLSAAFIIEEGLPMETLWQVAQSMRTAANSAGVTIVTGDTKVVEKGHGDGLFISTTGIGIVETGLLLGPEHVKPGDAVILSGDIARHGMAIMAMREGLSFESAIESDTAPLCGIVRELLAKKIRVKCMRDATRGGLAATLNEIAAGSGTQIDVHDREIPVADSVRGACEILGIDPLSVANEGRFVAFVAADDTDAVLAILRSADAGKEARRIGIVSAGQPGLVTIETAIGGRRILDWPSGELLPRIC